MMWDEISRTSFIVFLLIIIKSLLNLYPAKRTRQHDLESNGLAKFTCYNLVSSIRSPSSSYQFQYATTFQ